VTKKRKDEIPPAQPHPHLPYLLPVEDRLAAGKALRDRCPRKSHALWKAPAKRPDPIALLVASSKGRLSKLLPLRYGRMMVSPFTFYRGAAAVMASDLAGTPVTGLKLQACGDCHLLNFGGFATPERKLVFDINDFDETSISYWEWDVKRLAASFVLAGRSNGFDDDDSREMAWWAVRSYRKRMAAFANMSVLEAWYAAIDLEELIETGGGEEFGYFDQEKVDQAISRTAHAHELAKLTYISGDQPRISDDPPLIFHAEDVQKDQHYRQEVQHAVRRYIDSLLPARRLLLDRYRIVDVAMKVVGVGSVGTECGVILLMSGNGDSLFLQYKQAMSSVLEPYTGISLYPNHGQRVVIGQQIMQTASDLFLGWTQGDDGRCFYIRQLRDVKVKPVIDGMRPVNMRSYAKACGWALARAHARSADAVTLSGYLGSGDAFEDALVEFAGHYADQSERDHALLRRAIRAGRIEALSETG
jgi:uncharacterized protein (DUF2252 family)